MVIVQKENWGGIPLLHVYNEEMQEDAPIVVFLHGFMSAKEHNLHYAYNLVEKGMRVILPDALLHGDRSENLSEVQMNLMFWRIVVKNIEEVQYVYDILREKGYTGKVGVCGTSMGGITTAGCLKTYDWIEAAGILMGAVSYTELAEYQLRQMKEQGVDVQLTEEQQHAILEALRPYNLMERPEIFEKVPVMFWHGKNDPVVPFRMTYPFYEELVQQGNMIKVQYMADEKAGHAVSRAGVLAVTAWLAEHLA
ncbi:MAG: prolyl oligopeptidase family serine peptidase [Lysinibacillus sp.]